MTQAEVFQVWKGFELFRDHIGRDGMREIAINHFKLIVNLNPHR